MGGEYQIAETVRKLNQIERQIQGLLGHVRLLRGVRENIEARALLETANQLCVAGFELEEYLRQLVGEAESTARRFPVSQSYRARNLAQQIALNSGFASAVGYRNELRALAKRLPNEMDELQGQLRLLAGEANRGINDPGRFGDLAAPAPFTDVLAFVFQVLDAAAKWLERKKSARA
ncbi:MAG TPA: hypothetical protein VN943_12815 [Candidatus Acidoferrum sp.]|nr:hypothetical protein [Candidatus Acidoferrum sp.]